ncbi:MULTISPECIES: RidA family protein [unclassified Actinotalea]|uniref:RidA family protein n=1 Tax=unclassified Actinotalea TaxID=2638618 RepID=UPI0015F56E90|nr:MULTISPECIES: RidA family protein [unclassified Actinotalea]
MASARSKITTTGAPAPAHSFSQGVRVGDVLQVSGQGPADPETGEYVHLGDVGAQTTRTLENVRAVVEAGGATWDDVVMVRVYLHHQSSFAAMNDAYAAFTAEHVTHDAPPCRTTVFVGLPHPQMMVEIDAMAVVADR